MFHVYKFSLFYNKPMRCLITDGNTEAREDEKLARSHSACNGQTQDSDSSSLIPDYFRNTVKQNAVDSEAQIQTDLQGKLLP